MKDKGRTAMHARTLSACLCFLVLALAGCQKPAEPDSVESVPPSPEMTLLPSAQTTVPSVDENADVTLAVTETRKDACIFEIRNDADVIFSITKDCTLEHWENGAWSPCGVLRDPGPKGFSYEISAGETEHFVYDWSYACGTLAPGRYRLTVFGNPGTLIWHQGSITAEFELTGDEAAIEPAPAPAPWPDWAEASLTMVTPHKWLLRLSAEPEQKVRWEDDFSLFRKEGEDFVPVPAAYRLLGELHYFSIGEKTWNLNLAASYGELPPGDYLLRKRLLDWDAWPEERKKDWDLIEPEKLILLDLPFTLEEGLSDVVRETAPYDWLLYTPSLPVEERILVLSEDISPAGIQLLLENIGDEELIMGYNWFLYFLEGDEWFPVPTHIFGWDDLGVTLSPGETKSQDISFETGWDLLPPGAYRLVQELNSGKLIFCEFAVSESD